MNSRLIINTICQKSYKIIVFPITIGLFFAIFNFNSSELEPKSYLNFVLNFSLRIILVMVFFQEWIFLLIKNLHFGFFGLKRCSDQYIPCYLTYYLSLMAVLIAANLQFLDYYLEISFAIVLAFFIWFIKTRPYDDRIHNAGQIVNLLLGFTFLSWNIFRSYNRDACKEDN